MTNTYISRWLKRCPASAWFSKGDGDNRRSAQIDLLIDRRDCIMG